MNRYYFMGFIVVDGCNPNGDPTAENRPRIDYDGHGEISSVSIKRKIRDALCFDGEDISVRDDITADGFESQRKRAGLITAKTVEEFKAKATAKWIDTRLFGQLFQLPSKIKSVSGDVASIGIRGPATISQARSIEPIVIDTQTVTMAENAIEPASGRVKGPVTFGPKHMVWRSAYSFSGGISPQLAALTGATDEDAEKLKRAILSMYDYGASATRPDGSICLHRLLWWALEGNASPAKILRSVEVKAQTEWPYYSIIVTPVENAKMEEYTI